MAGLNHDFLVLPDDGDRWQQLQSHFNDPAAVTLHDDVLHFFQDTLLWIPSENPANPSEWSGYGLNWYGPTAITGPGARIAAEVFAAWANLLSRGPTRITLTGQYTWTNGESPTSGSYQKIAVDRDEITAKCRAISDLAVRAVEEGQWLAHFGI